MGFFDSPFFSLSGQVERLTNAALTVGTVVQNIGSTVTFGAIPSGGAISPTNPNPLTNLVATAANNPLTTAAIIAVPASSAARGTIASAVSGLSTGTKVGAIVAAPIAAGIFASNPIGTASTVVNAPSNLAGFGSDIGSVIKNPSLSSIESLVKDHPILTVATATAGLLAVGGGVSTAVNALNTNAVRENTKATQDGSPTVVQVQSVPSPAMTSSPSSVPMAAALKPIAQAKKAPAKKRKKAKKKPVKKKKKRKVNKKKKSKGKR